MNRLPETLPTTLRFAYRAGEARMERDRRMDKARLSKGLQRAEYTQLARSWHRSMLRNANLARQWYALDIQFGKAL